MLNRSEIVDILKTGLEPEVASVVADAIMTTAEAQLETFQENAASKSDLQVLHRDFDVLTAKVGEQLSSAKSDIFKEISGTLRNALWGFFVMGISVVGLTLGGVYFLLAHWKP